MAKPNLWRYLRDIRTGQNSLNDETWGASWEAAEITDARLDQTTCYRFALGWFRRFIGAAVCCVLA
jgi:hypothetical protein